MNLGSNAGISRRGLLAAAATTVVLAAGSTLGIAAATGGLASTCTAPTFPGTVVSVSELDMGHMSMRMMRGISGPMRLLAVPGVVPAGAVSFLVHNQGTRTHELVVLPLSSGSTAGGRAVGAGDRISETNSLGEASHNCGSGEGDGIHAGSRGWVTLRLPVGRYELVCNLKSHYRDGMHAELDVR